MKIEIEIPDITQEQVVEAMASRLLETRFADFEDDRSADGSRLGDRIAMAVERRIVTIAERLVHEHFDADIKERIGDAVTVVIEEGWYKTDSYGNRQGDRLDLKGRINEILTEKRSDAYNGPKHTIAEKLVLERVKMTFDSAFTQEINGAKAALRQQLDALITGKFTAAIKEALGLR